jgi:hypothetical protein
VARPQRNRAELSLKLPHAQRLWREAEGKRHFVQAAFRLYSIRICRPHNQARIVIAASEKDRIARQTADYVSPLIWRFRTSGSIPVKSRYSCGTLIELEQKSNTKNRMPPPCTKIDPESCPAWSNPLCLQSPTGGLETSYGPKT